jgi:ADP-ribose pyrophosphatase YjhB (NUDIX family)
MKFCSLCGADIVVQVPHGDTRERFVCGQCGEIHYQNPKIVAGCIPEWDGRILLCRRAIEPRHGWWTLPAGFMENSESAAQAAERETLEEANARVEIIELYTLLNLPQLNQVYMLFRARLRDLDFSPGDESLEVELFEKSEIPWDELAFPTVSHTLKFFVADADQGLFKFRMGDIHREGNQAKLTEHPKADQ